MKRLLLAIAFLIAIPVLAGLWLWQDFERFLDRPVNPGGPVQLWVSPGMGHGALGRELSRLGLLQPDWRWRLSGRILEPALRSGEYRIETGTSIRRLLAKIERGDVVRHRLTIVEGWTFAELRHALTRDSRLGGELPRDDRELMNLLDCHECLPEGWFLPETYFFVRQDGALDLLRRAHQAMQEVLDKAWQQRDPELPLDTPYELLILASIIERETGQAAERDRVAGVFVRRLNIGMRLQTDPTVIYGLDESFDGRLRRVHLRTDHPWNTYTRHGLPLTPIALPGRASIEAAARPADGTELYFVSRGDGSHHFSDTLAEHNAAVNRYIRGRGQGGGQ